MEGVFWDAVREIRERVAGADGWVQSRRGRCEMFEGLQTFPWDRRSKGR
jgi:hypothetical protein